ncbi:NAD-dependent epimerase/dehydratase family protein [Microbacterium sp. M3]|uniref:NAD-dependent epimerase/dehydratase family protein n=1 Tax=Microbacterium arthrosphaerae TaxID=792652 RepID=A0ABU4H170_9MICO|nr:MULTISPECIES: NAD-dependent epimerase/dehydratase family protein [Microbacterium]MDW4573069.1 NAD-dependent epimerase/dehydratase family protein [Microbacterium arthrosphaerae]MDW7606924.1 NAD-dependent epimerase/dehydratase family protein [Microbacterium sp. M3]
MTDVLVLGGTGWLSGRIAERWLDAGAAVTCLARGGREAPYGATLVVADRGAADAYTQVENRDWDEIVDISSNPAHVAGALDALKDRTRHWTYVSTVSVYASNESAGDDEGAELLSPAGPDQDEDYGRAKARAEASVRAAFGHRAAVVRPGLIVGPGDPTDRFGYWVGRLALAGDADVLVPDTAGRGAQVIDVDDLAEFAQAIGRERWTGVVNAVGDPVDLDRLLAEAREAARHTGALVPAADAWLEEHGVAYWMGPRSLPLWLPAGTPGFWTRSNAAYRLLGGGLRPVRDTLERTLADERARGLDRPRRAGLPRADELTLLRQLQA